MNQVQADVSAGAQNVGAQAAQRVIAQMGSHRLSWEKRGPLSWETSLETAVSTAERAANSSGLPQTVYMNADTAGWWHTNSLASILGLSEVAVTVLPVRYFL